MKEKFWKMRYTLYMCFKTNMIVGPTMAWTFAQGWIDSFGIEEDSPMEAVEEELSAWN